MKQVDPDRIESVVRSACAFVCLSSRSSMITTLHAVRPHTAVEKPETTYIEFDATRWSIHSCRPHHCQCSESGHASFFNLNHHCAVSGSQQSSDVPSILWDFYQNFMYMDIDVTDFYMLDA
jgi:hypothetical protein